MTNGTDHARFLALETAVDFLAREMRRATGYDLAADLRGLHGEVQAHLGDDPAQLENRVHFMTALGMLIEHVESD